MRVASLHDLYPDILRQEVGRENVVNGAVVVDSLDQLGTAQLVGAAGGRQHQQRGNAVPMKRRRRDYAALLPVRIRHRSFSCTPILSGD